MKKYILYIAAILMLCSSVAIAEWVPLLSNNILAVYYDPESVVRTGNKVRYWQMLDFPRASRGSTVKGATSVHIMEEMDCRKKTRQPLSSYFYEGHKGEGTVLKEDHKHGDTSPISPKSFGANLYTILCK